MINDEYLFMQRDLIVTAFLPPRIAVVPSNSDVFAQQKLAFKN